ncbi:MAG: wax ester/triacylglycerol synthase family O-acyltransferase, partial [Actinomycetia bacterium]|nr:wax ester/triacylglycerol synthase family O-acyltransferase [Actinomycetes bacterium]
MRQLTGVDASFLYMENSRTVGHVAGVIIVDPSTAPRPITAETLREFIGSRIHLLDPLRWRLVDVPLGIDLPYWVDDPDLDLEYHVRGLALPSPGTPEQLSEQAARIVSRRLDRAHPLWETYVIEGLQDGRVAILSKMHHAAVDGKAGVQVLTTLLDPSPDAREIPPPPATPPERVPGEAEMLTRGWMGLLGRPEAALRLAASVAKETHAGMGKWLSQGDAGGRGGAPPRGIGGAQLAGDPRGSG